MKLDLVKFRSLLDTLIPFNEKLKEIPTLFKEETCLNNNIEGGYQCYSKSGEMIYIKDM